MCDVTTWRGLPLLAKASFACLVIESFVPRGIFQIITIFGVGRTRGFQFAMAERELVKSDDVFVNPLTNDLTFQSFVVERLQGRSLYWTLPGNYTGNKVGRRCMLTA